MIDCAFQDGTAFNGVSVTAPGRARQYNTITEKYVNNAVRENEKSNVAGVTPMDEEEIGTNYQHHHDIEHSMVTVDSNGNNYIERGKNIMEKKSLRIDDENEKRIISHEEKLQEHFKV